MSQTRKNLGGQIISEDEIRNYVLERFFEVKKSKQIKKLVEFQTMNKHIIMAHDQNQLKKLGNIVANFKKNRFSEIIEEYEQTLKLALEKQPTTKSHINVIMHVFGHFSHKFNQIEKKQFLELTENFKNQKITLGKTLSEINPIIYRFNNTYLASQTYFLLYSESDPSDLFKRLQKETLKN